MSTKFYRIKAERPPRPDAGLPGAAGPGGIRVPA